MPRAKPRSEPAGSHEMVEAVDAADRPLAVVSLAEAHRQGLPHRAVLVMLFNTAGKLYIQKRSQGKRLYPGRWDLSATGHVKAGEAREAAALRELREELGIGLDRLLLWREVTARQAGALEFVSLYHAGRVKQQPRPNPEEVETGMWVDREELDYLAREFRDQLTPGLVHFWERDLIFPRTG